MPKVNIQIEVPDNIQGSQLEQKLLEKVGKHALEQAVLELYKEREISTETGAKMLGMSLWEFIPFLGQHQLSIFDYTEEEWQEELKNVERERNRLSGGRDNQ